MSAQDSIEDRVKAVVVLQLAANGIDVETVSNDSKLIIDLGFDSLDLVEGVMGIEDEFGLEISDEEGEKLLTVQQVIDYVTAKVKA
jgi:acyl carrier protein